MCWADSNDGGSATLTSISVIARSFLIALADTTYLGQRAEIPTRAGARRSTARRAATRVYRPRRTDGRSFRPDRLRRRRYRRRERCAARPGRHRQCGVPVDDCLIVDVFTQSEVCFEQLV